jgi:hypothetical protein
MKSVTLGPEQVERLVLGLAVEVDGVQIQIGQENTLQSILDAAERAQAEFLGLESLTYKELEAYEG